MKDDHGCASLWKLPGATLNALPEPQFGPSSMQQPVVAAGNARRLKSLFRKRGNVMRARVEQRVVDENALRADLDDEEEFEQESDLGIFVCVFFGCLIVLKRMSFLCLLGLF